MSVSEIWLAIGILSGVIGIVALYMDSAWSALLILAIGSMMASHATSDATKKADAEEAAKIAYWQTPHVLKQTPDGCKVYAYTIDKDWHYFTRCQNTASVQDETPRKVKCGKNCTKTVYDVSQTQ